MATWVIGDVQGCLEPLKRLLLAIRFDAARDRAIFCGDLVNRGPDSLGVLRWAVAADRAQPGSVSTVLGNHDLHFLARAAGLTGAKRRDTLDELLGAKDRDALALWLRRQAVLRKVRTPQGPTLIVHAGLDPQWTVHGAEMRARAAEKLLGNGQHRDVLAAVTGARAPIDPAVQHAAQFMATATRLRCCAPDGSEQPEYNGAPEAAPAGHVPWYAVAGRKSAGTRIVFGHWAALGVRKGPDWQSLDSGCVWGNALTALRLEDDRLVQVAAK
ncbi:MAG: symmetrical bis(5'-nucleosyl)-tetraphosphatase [Deltaproteobacteria bacterium]|nr:symmetrical bis(5'-nucleosyl)-tetraphosphatase [Deltaproteobacteria bacterium]